MDILVTGAGGFVCSNVVDVLLAAGHRVIAVDQHFDEPLLERWHGAVDLLTCPVEEIGEFQADALIHGAAVTASPGQSGQTPEENLRSNINPLLWMSAWSARNISGRSIFISSGAVFSGTLDAPLTETTPADPRGMYAVAKHLLETMIATLREEYRRDVVAVRFGSIYGPWEAARPSRPRVSPVALMIEGALKARRIVVSEPDSPRDWTYAPDIGRALLALLNARMLNHPLYHVSSAQPVTKGQIARLIGEMLPNVVVETQVDAALPNRAGYLDNRRFVEDTGFDDWTPLENGLRQTVAWMEASL